jgi:hypothetical protein
VDNLYNASQYVEKKMITDDSFNMDDKRWDEMIQSGIEKGELRVPRCVKGSWRICSTGTSSSLVCDCILFFLLLSELVIEFNSLSGSNSLNRVLNKTIKITSFIY